MKKLMKKYFVILMSMFMVFSIGFQTNTVEAASKQLIIVNTKYNKLSFYENDKLVRRFDVASGKPSTPTPTGKTKVANKIVNRPYYAGGIPGGHPNNPLGNRWMGIFGGSTYGIHGNNKESSIGKHVSGGCIRMHNAEIRWLFPKVRVGCPVLIDYSSKTDEQIAKKYGVSFKEPVKAGWKVVNGQKKYLKENGKYATNEWLTISGKKYHFNSNSLVDKGMQTILGKKYYFNKDGIMQTGWINDGEFKYYFDSNGSAHIGLLELNGKTYYFDQTGAMVTGSQTIDGIEYSFNEKGEAIANWEIVKGNNRYSTATELSKMNYTSGGTVVLVNGNAIVDGISATPLAASENASILLTDKDRLPSETSKRIKEIAPEKIIIIGGENTVSSSLESKIAKDYAVKVERISGKDRYDTSFEIAKKLVENGVEIEKVYIVSGRGEADALSIASKAGEEKQPIILTNKDSINKDMFDWLKEQNIQDAYFIGGDRVISNNVINSVNEITINDVSKNRISGSNREETNAKVIERFYKEGYSAIFAAKSNVLVDALSAGPIAAQRNCPVVLVNSNGLSNSQKKVLDRAYIDSLYQIGGGVSFKGMSQINSISK